MINVQEFLEAIQFRITGGSQYQWKCYGDNTHSIDSETGDFSLIAYFSRDTQEVFEIQAWDYIENRFYRWVDPEYLEDMKAECVERGVDFELAGDAHKFTDLEVEDDILEKVTAIARGEDYDHRMMITLNLTDEEELMLYRIAHEKDVTFNELVGGILAEHIERVKNASVQD